MNAKTLDFSSKHYILIRDEDGTLRPMDEPYFKATLLAPGFWMVLSDGDMTYLVEGEQEALVIDSGYGCGNIREFCQTLTEKPIHNIANTHDHFDHTANNYLFDCAYMSQGTYEKRTIPFPSFSGIDFPRDYPVKIIGDGDKIDLGNHLLEVIALKDHAVDSLAFLDRKNRILISGDEIIPEFQYYCRYSVEHSLKQVEKLMKVRSAYDRICTGRGCWDAVYVNKYYELIKDIYEGKAGEGEKVPSEDYIIAPPTGDPSEYVVFDRREARPCDVHRARPVDPNAPYKRKITRGDIAVIFPYNKIRES